MQSKSFEIIETHIGNKSKRKNVVYVLEVRHIFANVDLIPSRIERTYSDFLNLFDDLKHEQPELMANVVFPKKVILCYKLNDKLIALRSKAFESLLNYLSTDYRLITSSALLSFLQDTELSRAKDLLENKYIFEAYTILENNFKLLNKVLTVNSPPVLISLCRLLACTLLDQDLMPYSLRWAHLALSRYEVVTDSDLLQLYVPLLKACVKIWKKTGRSTCELEERLENLQKINFTINEQMSLKDAVICAEEEIFHKSMALTEVSSNKSFGGYQKVYSHESKEVGCTMKFGVYLPPQAEENKKLPVIYWLSGLTCTEANFIEKSGAQKYAAEHGVIIVNPDTSPRGLNIAGDSDAYDFGVGAGFYINATQNPWKNNYRMFNYVTVELPNIVSANFGVAEGKQSIMGHSMGGHGALICTLKNPGLYKSVSAFSPICNPSECPWGIKAFNGYFGPKETASWAEWDATELVKKYNGPPIELLIDQGLEDQFLTAKQLLPENLIEACKAVRVPAILKKREGYNHSYFYIASFIGEHIKYHADALLK